MLPALSGGTRAQVQFLQVVQRIGFAERRKLTERKAPEFAIRSARATRTALEQPIPLDVPAAPTQLRLEPIRSSEQRHDCPLAQTVLVQLRQRAGT